MIRKIKSEDKKTYMELVKEFYNSDAVLHSVPEKNFENTFNELMRSDVYAECYFFEYDGKVVGFALLSKTFSQEAGGIVIWIEELYILEPYRKKGLGSEFFGFVNNMPHSRLRLEVEPDNEKAITLYKRMGFDFLPYLQMIKENGYEQ